MNYAEVLNILQKNKDGRNYPGKSDDRYKENFITPTFKPKFGIDLASVDSVFTIGSCFARNIEDLLEKMGVSLPTKKFSAPKSEWAARPNGLLNEYNPGSINQKIMSALKQEIPDEETIIKSGDMYHDLLLCGGSGVTLERAVNRRKEINDVYDKLRLSEIVIITLGYIEAWYDNKTSQWLNRIPPHSKDIDSKRFIFRRLDVFDAMPLLTEALSALSLLNKKIILTVSPVPISTTMTNYDCVVANEFSKSVLRVCAERLSSTIKNVDYFPSYEMGRLPGFSAYVDDNVHIKDSEVAKITDFMVRKYREAVK